MAGEKPKLGAVTEIQGNKRLILDGCDGIVDYSDDEIILRAGRLLVRINGRDLRIKTLTEGAAVAEGLITEVKYGYS